MTFSEAILLLALIFVVAGGAYLYLQRRDRATVHPVTPYAEGLRAILDGDRLKALQRLKDCVTSDSSNVDAYLRLGTLSAEMDDLPRAIKIHRALTFRADLSQAQKIEVYRALAQDYLRTSDVSRALESIEQVLSLNKKDRWALEKKSALQSAQRDWSAAYDSAEKALQYGSPVSSRSLAVLKMQLGLKLCAEKKERDGRVQFREALKLDATVPGPYLYWGDSYIRENRTEDAVKIWRRLLDTNPGRSYLVFDRLETRLFDLGRFSEIEQIYRGLIRSDAKNVHAYAALSRFLEKRGDRGDAIAVLMDGLHQNPESLWLRRRLVQIYSDVRDVEHVIQLSRDILSRVMKEGYDFKCAECGHLSAEPLWHCPKCNKLDTYNA
jgi:lipopolysaccharide biosynthesis regulator YciM